MYFVISLNKFSNPQFHFFLYFKTIALSCFFDTFLNHLLLHFWLQTLHCFIGVGALIGPLVVDPFLDESNCTFSASWSANLSPPSHPDFVFVGSNTSDITAAPDTTQYLDYTTDEVLITRVSYAFWIMALINVSQWIRQN